MSSRPDIKLTDDEGLLIRPRNHAPAGPIAARGLGGNVDAVVHEKKIRVFNFIGNKVFAALVLATQTDAAAAHRAGGINRVGQKPEAVCGHVNASTFTIGTECEVFAGGCDLLTRKVFDRAAACPGNIKHRADDFPGLEQGVDVDITAFSRGALGKDGGRNPKTPCGDVHAAAGLTAHIHG